MNRPLSEDLISYIVVGYDKDSIQTYHLRANAIDKERVRVKFEILAEHNGWTPFRRIEVYRLSTTEELENIVSIGPECFT